MNKFVVSVSRSYEDLRTRLARCTCHLPDPNPMWTAMMNNGQHYGCGFGNMPEVGVAETPYESSEDSFDDTGLIRDWNETDDD